MEPTDPTTEILNEIRADLRAMKEDLREGRDGASQHFAASEKARVSFQIEPRLEMAFAELISAVNRLTVLQRETLEELRAERSAEASRRG